MTIKPITGKAIPIGIRGENLVTEVEFDLSEFIAEYGDGTAVLLAKRYRDENPYPVTIVQDGETATWTVSETDCAYKGPGECELFWYVGEKLAKSVVYTTVVAKDIGEPGETPDPYESWIQTLTELGAETLANAQAAEDAKDDAVTAKEAAEIAAESAQSDAEHTAADVQTVTAAVETAQEAAQTATEASETATDAATSASTSATAAAQSAGAAETSASSAADSVTLAHLYATQAGNSSSSASDSAVDAQRHAQAASASATSAETAATSAATSASTATTKASEANTSAGVAASNATTATVKAQEAAQSTTQAAQSATAAQTAQTAAEAAQTAAETAQTAAESAASSAEAEADRAERYADRLIDVYPTDTASGPIASFPDGADGVPVKSLVVNVEPNQDLHGYDNPWPAGGGKNLYYIPDIPETTNRGVTYSVTNGVLSINGTLTGGITLNNVAYVLPNNTYTASVQLLSGSMSGVNSSFNFYLPDDTRMWLVPFGASGVSVKVTQTGAVGKTNLLLNSSGVFNNAKIAFQFEANSDMTPFAPYSNICPITGWTGANVSRTGFNVWDEEAEIGGINTTTGETEPSTTRLRSKNYIPVRPNTTYCGINGDTAKWTNIFSYDINKAFIQHDSMNFNGSNTYTTPANAYYIKLQLHPDYGTTYNNDVSINYPSTDHDYHAYSGTTIPITWQTEAGTVYGGTLTYDGDGVWTVESNMALVDLGTLNWTRGSTNVSGEYRFIAIPPIPVVVAPSGSNTVPNMVCSHYQAASPNATYTQTQGVSNNVRMSQLTLFDPVYKSGDVAAFKATMNGVMLCYETTQTTTFTLTTEQVVTLLGHNNFWADCGDTSVEYRADIQLYIQKMIAAALNS